MKKKYKYQKKENGKNDTGRPTDYKSDYCRDIVLYFENSPKTERVVKAVITGKNDYSKTEYETIPCELPTISKYARKIGIATKTLYEWAKVYPDFSNALDEVREIYKNFLNDNGLRGYYNPLYTKFVAINTTDMKDKNETDVTVRSYEKMVEDAKKYGLKGNE